MSGGGLDSTLEAERDIVGDECMAREVRDSGWKADEERDDRFCWVKLNNKYRQVWKRPSECNERVWKTRLGRATPPPVALTARLHNFDFNLARKKYIRTYHLRHLDSFRQRMGASSIFRRAGTLRRILDKRSTSAIQIIPRSNLYLSYRNMSSS